MAVIAVVIHGSGIDELLFLLLPFASFLLVRWVMLRKADDGNDPDSPSATASRDEA